MIGLHLGGALKMAFGKDFFLKNMVEIKRTTTKRISSWDRTGANRDFISIPLEDTVVLADIRGAGCINHFYVSPEVISDRHHLRKLLLRMFWDGEKNPSVEVPLGDFFGLGHCRTRLYTSLLVCVNQGASTTGFNSYFPMPFSDGAKIELLNEGEEDLPAFWYHIEYEEYKSLNGDVGRFHAQWRRENPCNAINIPADTPLFSVSNLTGENNYVILEAEGKGQYVGLFLNVDNVVGGWWGEGDDMIFVDGENWPPSYHGTGTEEVFGGGACPNKEYAGPYTGFHLISNLDWSGKNSMYRFYVTDPVRFKKSIKVTIEHGHANNLANDYSSTAFWYQTEPHKPFPRMLPVRERVPREAPQYLDAMRKEKRMYELFNNVNRVLTDDERRKAHAMWTQINADMNSDKSAEANRKIGDVMKILMQAAKRTNKIK
jgi:hypothetical protein